MAVVVMRLQNPNTGVLTAYAIDGDKIVDYVINSFADVYKDIPKPLKPVVDSFLFGLRHGPVRALFKGRSIVPVEMIGADRNALTLGHLVQLYFDSIVAKSIDSDTGQQRIIDIPASSVTADLMSVVMRVPELDGAYNELPEPVQAESN